MLQKHFSTQVDTVSSFSLTVGQAELQQKARHIAQTVAGPMAAKRIKLSNTPSKLLKNLPNRALWACLFQQNWGDLGAVILK